MSGWQFFFSFFLSLGAHTHLIDGPRHATIIVEWKKGVRSEWLTPSSSGFMLRPVRVYYKWRLIKRGEIVNKLMRLVGPGERSHDVDQIFTLSTRHSFKLFNFSSCHQMFFLTQFSEIGSHLMPGNLHTVRAMALITQQKKNQQTENLFNFTQHREMMISVGMETKS